MGFFKSVKHTLGIFTPEERYQRGKDTVDAHLNADPNPEEAAYYLHNMASGGFNRNEGDIRFDQGVKDRLEELGYSDDPPNKEQQ